MKNTTINVKDTIDDYLFARDWRNNANANQTYCNSSLVLAIAGKTIANYWLNEIYTDDIAKSHKNADFHIHDLDYFSSYCSGWSLRQLLHEGLNGVPGKTDSGPAKHLNTALAQLINFFGILQNEAAGAQAVSSWDTYLAPYIKKDTLGYQQVKQSVQEFVFGCNIPSRFACQTPFTNISIDVVPPTDLKDKKPEIAGEIMNFTYGDCQKEMDMLNRAFLEIMREGDSSGRIFSFPILTVNLTKDFKWESELSKLLFEQTAKYGSTYWQNYIGSNLDPGSVRSMCCRLSLSLRELKMRGNGLFGAGEMTGSIGVVTINLAKLGYLNKGNKDSFFLNLEKIMNRARNSLEIKRKVVTDFLEKGLYPYTKRYLGDYHNHFSTIGVAGGHECVLNFLGKGIETEEGRNFIIEVLDFMRNKLSDYQEETGNLFNLEATPGESACYRLAKEDIKNYPEIIQSGTKEIGYYTNSTQLPVGITDNVLDALDLQEEIQTKFTGGTIFHVFVGEKIQDWKTCMSLVKKIAENYKIPYFSITPTFSICLKHGYINGEAYVCPTCGDETEVWSRIVGYYRKISQWNIGKKQEFKDRVAYSVPLVK